MFLSFTAKISGVDPPQPKDNPIILAELYASISLAMNREGHTSATNFPNSFMSQPPNKRDCEEVTAFPNPAVVNHPLWVSWLRIQEMRNLTAQETGVVGRDEN